MTESFENYPFDGGEGCLPLIGPCGKEFQHRNFFLIKSDYSTTINIKLAIAGTRTLVST